jgi:CRP-like cAMP-binding protein
VASASRPAVSALVAKLSHFAPLADDDARVLEGLCNQAQRLEADVDVVAEGEVPPSPFVLIDGMAYRYRLLPDGKRQILTFLLPGDVFELHAFLFTAMDYSVGTLVPTRIAPISRDIVTTLFVEHPRIGAALWWSAVQQEAIQRERIVALGRRTAAGRVAYLLSELVSRMRAVGVSHDHAIGLPLTQPELADTLGLTAVHINRVLKKFRSDGLITLERRRLVLQDVTRLHEVAGFDEGYLHLGGASAEVVLYYDRLESERAEGRAARDRGLH